MLTGTAAIDERKSELEIEATLVRLLEATVSRYLRKQNAKRRIPSSELVQIDGLTEKENSQIAEQDDYLEAIGNIPLEEILKEDLNRISPREKKVLRMRFGLLPYEREHTYEEIGLKFDVTRERIRQIEAKGLRKLRKIYELKQNAQVIRTNQARHTKKAQTSSETTEKVVVKVDPEILKKSIDVVDLGPRLTVSFEKMCRVKHIGTIEQLVSYSRMSLRGQGFGDKGLGAMNQWLGERGLSLRKTTWDVTDEELLNSPEALKQDWRIDFNLEDLFLTISDLRGEFLKAEPTYGEQIISLLERAGKRTIFDLLESHWDGLTEILNNDHNLFGLLDDFFHKNYNMRIGYCSSGELEQIARWYNTKLKQKKTA